MHPQLTLQRLLACIVFGLSVLLFSVSQGAAQTRLYVDCPNGPPCKLEVTGHIDSYGTGRLPWVASVVAPAGVCLYVTGITADSPLSGVLRTVIAPDGTVYRAKSAIGVTPTIAGWYTIQLDTAPPGREQVFKFAIWFVAAGSCSSTPGR